MAINVTVKSGFDMGAIRTLTTILRVFNTLLLTQIRNHHPDNLALCGSLVRVHRLRVNIESYSAVRVS